MARLTVDIELLMVGLLDAYLPDVDVRAAVDVDLIDSLPMVIVQPVTGQMISNGSPALGWEWIVSLAIYNETAQSTSDLADLVYATIHRLHDDQAAMAGVGYVSSVEDQQMPVRTATVKSPTRLTQFNGVWTVRVRPPQNV